MLGGCKNVKTQISKKNRFQKTTDFKKKKNISKIINFKNQPISKTNRFQKTTDFKK